MKTSSGLIFLFLASIFSALSPCAMASSYDDAVEAAKSYTDSYEDIRKIDFNAVTRLVAVLCGSNEDDLESVSRDEESRLVSQMVGQKNDLDAQRTDADSKILAAMADPQSDDEQKEELSKSQDRIAQIAKRMEKIIENGTKLGSNPVFNRLRESGQMAHNQYYVEFPNCKDYRDIQVGRQKPDCILPPDDCMVIELKSNNESSKSDGWAKAESSSAILNTTDGFQALPPTYQMAFSGCMGKFRPRLDCYKYCPEVNDDGTFKDGELKYNEGCKS